jgi:hypothetical protein
MYHQIYKKESLTSHQTYQYSILNQYCQLARNTGSAQNKYSQVEIYFPHAKIFSLC